jgi:hypothetical protein
MSRSESDYGRHKKLSVVGNIILKIVQIKHSKKLE